jgi:hypothetical protein
VIEEELEKLLHLCKMELEILLPSIEKTIDRVEKDKDSLRDNDIVQYYIILNNYDYFVLHLDSIYDPNFALVEEFLEIIRVKIREATNRNNFLNRQIDRIDLGNEPNPFFDETVSEETVSDKVILEMTWWQRGVAFFRSLFVGRNHAQLYPEIDENIETQLKEEREERLKQQKIEKKRIEEMKKNREIHLEQEREEKLRRQEINEQRQEKWKQERAERREQKEREQKEREQMKREELEQQEQQEREQQELEQQGKGISSDPTYIESGENSRSVYAPLAGVVMPFEPLEPLPSSIGGSFNPLG